MTEEAPKRRRWFQFRLRTLLVAVLVLSLPLSWFAVEVKRTKPQRKAAEAFERLGCEMLFDRSAPASELGIPKSIVGVPTWVVATDLPLTDSDLRHFRELPDIEGIHLENTGITHAGLQHL